MDDADPARWSDEQIRAGLKVDAYLDRCATFIRAAFARPVDVPPATENAIVDAIVRVLLSREFNYQAKGRVTHLLPDLRHRLAKVVQAGQSVPVYFLYHGGYRASSDPACLDLIFAPDATELLLLFQAARLQQLVQAIYPPGISFALVVNDGVAAFTNDIPYARTRAYVARLKRLIAAMGADHAIWVMTQSDLGDFDGHMRSVPIAPAAAIAPSDHRIVERFLGRRCTVAEAGDRTARYLAAETAWAAELGAIIAARSGFFVRQVAHPACLSFRPFPGGATRTQNGTIGFRVGQDDHKPLPFLVTASAAAARPMVDIPVRLSAIVPHGFDRP